jgi:hypothetical protein
MEIGRGGVKIERASFAHPVQVGGNARAAAICFDPAVARKLFVPPPLSANCRIAGLLRT